LKTIVGTVAKDGSTKVETKGFTGSACQAASDFLEKALGARQSERLTADYFSGQVSQQQHQEGSQA
jgi:hypothetical protein